ncbi:MAG: hypothetical protein J4G15_10180 [Alphaproteobacteria bacterium]|nr:hypothetical protein [Alphaproteobacteria bacterium]
MDTVIVADTDMQGRFYGEHGVATRSVALGWGRNHSLDPGYRFTGWRGGGLY